MAIVKRNQVNVRLKDDENAVVERIAGTHNISKSEVIRLALNGELAKVEKRKNNSLSDDERSVVLLKMGAMMGTLSEIRNQNSHFVSNVNQIAKVLNSGGQGVSQYDATAYEKYGKEMSESQENIAKELNALWHILA